MLKDGETAPPLLVPSGYPVAHALFPAPVVHTPVLHFFLNFIPKYVFHKAYRQLTLVDIDHNIPTNVFLDLWMERQIKRD